MSDLISRKALKQAIIHDFYEHYTKYHDTDQIALIELILDDIDEMPTAFDKEKVEKKISNLRGYAENRKKQCYVEAPEYHYYDGMFEALHVIEQIIEKGGIE